MRPLENIITTISLWMARVGGLFLLAAAFVISFEIIARKLFLLPFSVGTELSTYALAVGASWSFSYALINRAHVRIDVVRNTLPVITQALLDILALISLAAFAMVLTWHAYGTFATSWSLGSHANTPLATPITIPQGLWFMGLLWFFLVSLQQIVAAITALLHKDFARLNAIAGPPSFEDEIGELPSEAKPRLELAE